MLYNEYSTSIVLQYIIKIWRMLCVYFSDLEWMLAQVGAIKTELEENPRSQVQDVMSSAIRSNFNDDDSDEDY